MWSRRGLEVIRGHTTPLVVDRELLYVEPLFVRSRQNPVPQLERVVVVFRGRAYMGRDLEAALREAVEPRRSFPIRPGPELGGEPAAPLPDGEVQPEDTAPATPPAGAGAGGGEAEDEGGGPPPGRGPG